MHRFDSVLSWRPGRYLSSSGKLLVWLLLRAFAQAATVVLLSIFLGANGYGQFVAVLAVASFLTPFAGMGLAHVLLRDGSRAPEKINGMLRQALLVWLATFAACATAAIALAWWLLPDDLPSRAVVVAMLAEVATTSFTELIARTEQARHRIGRFGAINAGLPLTRLIFLLGYAMVATPTLSGWLWIYAAGSATYALLLSLLLPFSARVAKPRTTLRVKDGIPFTMASLSTRLQAEFSKPVLAAQGFALAGNFGAAQRVADLASLPLMALQDTLWPRLYGSAKTGSELASAGGFMLTLALIGGSALWIISPMLPRILGFDFGDAAETLRWLSLLPLVQCARNLTNFLSISRHRTSLVGWSYAAGSLTSVLLLLVLTPRQGILAAVAAAYASEFVIIGVQLFSLSKPSRHD